jgi:hypothetical protein
LIEANSFDFSPVNLGPGRKHGIWHNVWDDFGGVHYPERHHALTHSLGASIILDIITHSGPPNIFFNVLSFFHSPVAAVGAAAKVGRVSVESGVDWVTFYSKFQMTLLAADAYELKTLECAVLNSRITKRYLKL